MLPKDQARISKKAGLIVEQLSEQNGKPRLFVIEDALSASTSRRRLAVSKKFRVNAEVCSP
ncbi:hypothetical protein WA1_03765 [Scytonema hofmannii PCC 7110]|uniref:Uncharacterized protein n=1 Tax=Scytonema hofmannii PCC 7110 TaxID=128403 RepID=A0A139X996_9CYAN|nr:hypothetical protein [Scytonema hofmannii]KYC41212.1 hypothetical protein WA1_03765 [Scytonema hofmannii PCC 7110]